MNVLILDVELMGLDLAARCVDWGHRCRLYHQTPHPIGKGFTGVQIVDDWQASLSWAKDGLIVTTGNAKWLHILDRYREFNLPIFAPTVGSARLEIERSAGMDALKAIGVDLPHFETFDSLEDAEKFARKSDQAYVFKPMGSEDKKELTYVSHSPADMVGWLQRQSALGYKLKAPCMLQEKIDMIAEIGVSGWFGPEGFLEGKYQECWEFKKLGNDDTGPATGEMGTVCQYVESSKLAEDFLLPMAPALQALGHRGDFAVGCGIDSKGKAWPFEFTARLGWPAFLIQVASHRGDPAQWMKDLLVGKDTLKCDYRPAIGVVMAQPPFPQWNGKAECVEGVPVCGLDEVWDQVHPAMMMIGKGPYMDGDAVKDGPVYQTAGELVCVVTGLGSTVSKAREKVYGAVDTISYSDAIFRTDVGAKLEKQLPKVHGFGFAMDMEWD